MVPPYPELSQKLGEQGVTTLMVDIGADGAPSATHVTKSSGSLRLDDAAAAFVKDNWRWQAPTRQCKPVAFATDVSVVWNLSGMPPQGPPFNLIAAADSDFPKGAKEEGAHGATMVGVLIAPDGTVNLDLASSSGFNDLDGAAFRKIGAMKFAPATANGRPAATVLFFRVDWGQEATPAATSGKVP
jgi:TonB family protein